MAAWWATLIVGLAVLLFGRRLFWLFVGATGFAVGLHGARVAGAGQPEWVIVVAALVLGLIGALLALLFQWLAIGVGGFLGGAAAALALADAWRLEGRWLWALVLAAGVVGAVLLLWLWDSVLIALSVLVGAALLTPLAPAAGAGAALLFLALIVVGILVQSRVGAPAARAAPSAPGRRA
jgi:hypothetical protein